MLRKNHGVMEQSVNSIPYDKLLFHRFDMNIRRLLEYRMLEESVHDSDNGKIFSALFEVGRGGHPIPAFGELTKRIGFLFDEISKLRLERFLILKQNRFDRGGISQSRQNLEVCFLLDEVYCGKVVRIEHRHLERILAPLECHDVVAPCYRFGQESKGRQVDFQSFQINERD